MTKVVLIGTGNLATHLLNAFQKSQDINIAQVYGRSTEALRYFEKYTETTTDQQQLINADLYLISVSDDAIVPVSKQLADKEGLIVHTSGSVPITALTHTRSGVFYPLQTFTKEKAIDFRKVPIAVEANSGKDLRILEKMAQQISDQVVALTSQQRQQLHLAAVFVNNFTNHLLQIAQQICHQEAIDFQLLIPLLEETAQKIRILGPQKAQTGPAKRNDIMTMQRHLDSLEHAVHKKIYQLMSESIRRSNEKEL